MDGLGDHDVVEGVVSRRPDAVPQHLAVQHAARADAVLSAQGALQFGQDGVDGDGGEETQTAQVDGEERDFPAPQGACRGQQGAIASEDDQQVAAVGDFFAGHAAARAEIARRHLVEPDRDPARLEPLDNAGDHLGGLRHLGFRDDARGLNVVHATGTPGSLPRPGWGSPSGRS